MITLLAKPVLAGLVLVASGPALPRIDIPRTCAPRTCAATAAGDDPRSCISEEGYARKKIVKDWGRTPLMAKKQCIDAAEPPAPSYIVLRDGINNAEMVRQIHGQQ